MPHSTDQVIGLDLGGTKLLGGTLTADNVLGAELKWPTETGSTEVLIRQIAEMVAALRDERNLRQVVLGVPAAVDPAGGALSLSPNVPLGGISDLASVLTDSIGAPVAIENDANLAALAEAREGAGKGGNVVCLVSLGTGIGMGAVIHGRMLLGARGQAGELGSAILNSGEMLEDLVGTPGILTRDPWNAASVTEIFARADSGESDAQTLIDNTAQIVAHALSFVLTVLDPDTLVVGGGIGTQTRFYDALNAHLQTALAIPFTIAPAELGARAGLLGALIHARDIVSSTGV